jgi:hypothetical protein
MHIAPRAHAEAIRWHPCTSHAVHRQYASLQRARDALIDVRARVSMVDRGRVQNPAADGEIQVAWSVRVERWAGDGGRVIVDLTWYRSCVRTSCHVGFGRRLCDLPSVVGGLALVDVLVAQCTFSERTAHNRDFAPCWPHPCLVRGCGRPVAFAVPSQQRPAEVH